MRRSGWAIAALIALACGAIFTASASSASPAQAVARPVLANGSDVSWLPPIEAAGSKFYTSANKQIDPLKLMKQQGLTAARVRLWVTPTTVDSSLAQTLALARRIKAAGLQLVLDLHYSDTWADPSNQQTPDSWSTFSKLGLREAVYDYTRNTIQEFVDQGTPPAWVQIGNEIANGMLWPTGRLNSWTDAEFSTLVSFLNAGGRAAREVSPRSKIMIHLETGGDPSKTRAWLTKTFEAGLQRPDAIGLSYYSQWAGSMGNLDATLKVVAVDFELPVAIAETAYPNSSQRNPKPLLDADESRLDGFELTQAGQAKYATAIVALLRKAAGSRAVGVWWWEGFSPNKPKLQSGVGPSLLAYSSLVTLSGKANLAMTALGKASK